MEVLAGVSSVLSVLGFAIQLADGIKKACALWESLQEAPHEVQMICKDLRAISNILDDIKIEENHSRISQSLKSKDRIPKNRYYLVDQEMARYEGSHKDEKLQGLQSRLNSAKPTLVLARQNSSQLLSMQTHKSQQQLVNMVDGIKLDLQELASKPVVITSRDLPDSNAHFDALKVEARALACNIKNPAMRLGFDRAMDLAFSTLSNPAERSLRRKSVSLHSGKHSISITNTPFGTINIYITTLSFADGTYKSRTNLIMHPSRLLQLCGVSLGVRIALSKSCGTFKPELKAYRAVPDDSTIFRLCRDGRIDAIRCLFDEGLASPRDTDSYGRTPLMIAASTGQLSTCKFLVNEGADLEVRDIQNNDLGSYACGTWSYDLGKGGVPFGLSHNENQVRVPCDIRIEVLRMFLEQFEVSEDPNSSGVVGLYRLAHTPRLVADRKLLFWAASMLQDQLILTSNLRDYFLSTLISAMKLEDTNMIHHLFRSHPHDITEAWNAPSIWRCLAKKLRSSDQTHLIRCMISYGMDLHNSSAMLSFTSLKFPEVEYQGTITGCLLQSSAAFFRFKTTLQNLGIDIAKFVCDEIQQGPAAAAGWTTQNLLAAFNLDYIPGDALPYFTCLPDCQLFCYNYGREFSWEILLEKLKPRSDLSSGLEDILREREEDLVKFQSIDGRICSGCGELGMSHATENEQLDARYNLYYGPLRQAAKERETEVEDSMFL
ncbi:uncharacterized protein EAE98_007866 [Botrytis deweyae]|uniref:Fungal N-terminal domain-containing protein n=1 Tax=Botrytis deweyae TaxID=2478750 RepID=A0ABQ7IG79_9HELO|nr:uncharacterized protein EAE98_007866 [Botrytis deweyae]KAF7923161.1 hypothetical protein EAE98_007866 [Botrytis deweyae]